MGRPRGSKNKPKEDPPAVAVPSAPAEAPAKTYSEAFKGMSFGQTTKDSQEVFQIRLLKPDAVIRNKDVLDYFNQTKHRRSLFGLHRHEKDLIASFHHKEAREEFLEKRILKIGKAEVHVATFPSTKHALKGAKFIISSVPMTATGPGVQKALHPFNVERFLFEKHSGTEVRTGRVIFWSTEKVPNSIYILGTQVGIKQVGPPTAPPNTPASPPKEKHKDKDMDVEEEKLLPQTPTHQAQKASAPLAEGSTPKRKDVSPLSNPAKLPRIQNRLESEAPIVTAEFLKDLGLPIPTAPSVLSIYEDVTDKVAQAQNKEIPSPLGKNKQKVTRPHDDVKQTEDWFVLNQPDGSFDEDTVFHYEGSLVNERSNRHYAGMRWVQRLSHEGVISLVIFKSRIYHFRQHDSLRD